MPRLYNHFGSPAYIDVRHEVVTYQCTNEVVKIIVECFVQRLVYTV
ncbi:hypothetical protein [Campylobacter anatolicus]|nr:hypothetical protein [Campylobacter anatolicus]MBR8462910.1 hypothetical protein [Campylobacter anatolicus]